MYYPLYTVNGCNHSTEDVLFRLEVNNALREMKGSVVHSSPMSKTNIPRQYSKLCRRRHRLTLGGPVFKTELCQRLLYMTLQHMEKRKNRERPQRRGLIREAVRLVECLGQHKDVYRVLKSFLRSFSMEDQGLLMGRRSRSDPPAFES